MALKRYILLIIILLISLPVWAGSVTDAGNVLMIYFRSDCAPCRQEIKVLPEIAAVHQNLAIEVIAMDGTDIEKYISGALPKNVRIVAGGEQEKEMLQHAASGKVMLPFSIFLDNHGRICGKHLGILGTDTVNKWIAMC